MRIHASLMLIMISLTWLLAGCEQADQSQSTVSAEQAGASDSASGSVPGSNVEPDQPLPEIAPAAKPVASQNGAASAEAKEIDWDALIPEEWQPDTLMASYNIEELEDDDPKAQELAAKLKELWDKAPVVQELDGQRVKLPGFVVPLEMDAQTIDEFLLVPYYGACIHVPPPPANQTVHVVAGPGKSFGGQLFDTVWVTGTVRVEHLSSDLAESGYRLEDASVEPYE